MSDKILGYKITANAEDANNSVKSFRGQIREATQDLVAMSEKFGNSSKEAREAAKRVAELKDRMGDARQMVDAFNPDAKFKAFSQSISGVASAFTAFQGVLGLVGIESKNVEKQLLRVQSALAFSEGLNNLLDGGLEGFRNLYRVISDKVITAFGSLRSAIITTGIGALVVALGYAIANFDKLSVAIGLTTKESQALDSMNEEVSKSMTSVYENVNKTTIAFNQAKAGVISKKEALKIYNETLGKSLGYATTYNEAERLFILKTQAYIEASRARATAQMAIAKSAALQLKIEEATKDPTKATSTIDKVLNFTSSMFSMNAGALYNIKNIEDGKKETAQLEKQKLLYDEIANKQTLIALNKEKEYNVTVAGIEKVEAKKKEHGINENKGGSEHKGLDDSQLEEIQAEKDMMDAKKELAEKSAEDSLLAKKEYNAEELGIELAHKDAKTKAFQADYENFKYWEEQKLALKEAMVDADRNLEQTKFDFANSILDLGASLSQKNKKIADAIFVVQKALAIGNIIVDTNKEIASYWANPTWSLMPDGGAAIKTTYSTAAKLRAGASIATIVASSIGKFMNGSGSASSTGVGANAPVVGANAVTQTVTKLEKGTIDLTGNAAIKAYVVETDLANSQDRIERILVNATFK